MYSESSHLSGRRKGDGAHATGSSGVMQSPTKVSSGLGVLRPSSSTSSISMSPSRTPARRTRTMSGSRSNSPLTLQMDGLQGITQAYNNINLAYVSDQIGSPAHSSGHRSPYMSPAHSRSSSMTSMKSLLQRDRSDSLRSNSDSQSTLSRTSDTHKSPHAHGGPHGLPPRGQGLLRDRSLDRNLDRHLNGGYHTLSSAVSRERSLDREQYSPMSARSFDRDLHLSSNLVRSQSIDHEYLLNQALYVPSSTELRHTRDSLIIDLQAQMAELNKECSSLQRELDSNKDKLSSSMNSIKTFWSPELKKERAMRKEESCKLSQVQDTYRIIQAQNTTLTTHLQSLESEVKALRQSRCTDASGGINGDSGATNGEGGATTEEQENKRDKERQSTLKETRILKRTVQEMELRIKTQKQTLEARDKSINSLMAMLKNKGQSVSRLEEDGHLMDEMRSKCVEAEAKVEQLEEEMQNREATIRQLKQDLTKHNALSWNADRPRESCSLEMLEAMLDNKDSRIGSLEKEVKLLEDELLRLREEAIYNKHSGGGSPGGNHILQVESLKGQEKLLKAKIEHLKAEVTRKDTELHRSRAQLETLTTAQANHEHHLSVLRDQVTARQRQLNMLQTDLDLLQERVKEKDKLIEAKVRQVSSVQSEKKQLEQDIRELHDHLDIKDRKTAMLTRKLEHIEDLLSEKESEVSSLRAKLASYTADHSTSSTAVTSLEESLSDRDKQIHKLKEQRERLDLEHQEELEQQQRREREIKNRLEIMHSQLDDKQHEVIELREKQQELSTEKLRCESVVSQLDMELSTKSADLVQALDKIKKLEEEHNTTAAQTESKGEERIEQLTKELADRETERDRTQTELDRLLQLLKDTENEKHEKDNTIRQLQDQLKEHKTRVGSLKRNHQTDKRKNLQMLEEARKRENSSTGDLTQLRSAVQEKSERIEELEMALKESVSITAEREMVLMEEQHKMEAIKEQLSSMQKEVEERRAGSEEMNKHLQSLSHELDDQTAKVTTLLTERNKCLEEAYEMKQEAILAAITEKDAHIALLEMTPNKNTQNIEEVEKLTGDKIGLQKQLKDLTQTRMKLLAADPLSELNKESTKLVSKYRDAPPEQVKKEDKEDGIWA